MFLQAHRAAAILRAMLLLNAIFRLAEDGSYFLYPQLAAKLLMLPGRRVQVLAAAAQPVMAHGLPPTKQPLPVMVLTM